MYAGEDSTVGGTACQLPFSFTIGANDDAVTTIAARSIRSCRYCTGTTAKKWLLKDFVLPMSTLRLVSGISVWLADASAGMKFTAKADPT